MTPDLKRLAELAAGWSGSDAVVSLSAADAVTLGLPYSGGRPVPVRGGDLETLIAEAAAPRPAVADFVPVLGDVDFGGEDEPGEVGDPPVDGEGEAPTPPAKKPAKKGK